VNFITALVWLPESLPAELRTSRSLIAGLNPFAVLATLFRRPLLRSPLIATFLCNLAFSGYLTSFALFTNERFDWGPQQVAIVLVVQSIISILVQTFGVRQISSMLPDTTILVFGIGANLLGFLVIAVAPTPAFLYLVSAPLQAIGSALWRPSLSSLITKLVSNREQGLANGGSQAASALATIVGPLGAGLLFERVGITAPFLAGGLMFALAAATIEIAVRSHPELGRARIDAPGAAPRH
jgi:DHA1 family tetracycline resistance protein-like MFS transporter